jgi:hypothetical protein
VIVDSLARAGIHLKVKTYEANDLYVKSLSVPAKRREHQLGQTGWIQGWPGDNARDTIVPRYDSRVPADFGANYSQ